MLNRLVSKKILKRERRQGAFVYQPCTASHDLRERAIRKLSDDYFEGSILGIAQAAVTLLAREQQSALEALSRHLEAARVPGSSN
jgi:predicted transcriptional regulator